MDAITFAVLATLLCAVAAQPPAPQNYAHQPHGEGAYAAAAAAAAGWAPPPGPAHGVYVVPPTTGGSLNAMYGHLEEEKRKLDMQRRVLELEEDVRALKAIVADLQATCTQPGRGTPQRPPPVVSKGAPSTSPPVHKSTVQRPNAARASMQGVTPPAASSAGKKTPQATPTPHRATLSPAKHHQAKHNAKGFLPTPDSDVEWTRRLASAPINHVHAGVRDVSGTHRMKIRDAGIQMCFRDSTRAYFKGCTHMQGTAVGERYTGEIAGYHLDRLLGLHRTPVVVGRVIDTAELRHAINDTEEYSAKEKRNALSWVSQFSELHAHNGTVPGAMIQWYDGELKVASFDELDEYITHRREVTRTNKKLRDRIGEWTNYFVFEFLGGNHVRRKGNYHEDERGSLVYLDNDRLFIAAAARPARVLRNGCMYTRGIVNRLRQVSRAQAPNAESTLGALLRRSLARDPLSPVLAEEHFDALDDRVGIMLETVHKCVERWGEEKVLL